MNRSAPGLPVHHQLVESTQTHAHWVGGEQQRDSAVHVHVSILPQAPLPSRQPVNMEQRSRAIQ